MTEEEAKTISIGDIGNYYGGLKAKKDGCNYFWGIENWDGTDFEEIPEYLFNALIKFKNDKS